MIGRSKQRALAIVLAVVILAISVIPALAGFDSGEGVDSFELEREYPAAVLRAEGWQ